MDAGTVAIGTVLPQTVATPTVANLTGGFALLLSGYEPPSQAGSEAISGQLTFTLNQAMTATLDLASNGALTTATVQFIVVGFDSQGGTATIAAMAGSPGLNLGTLRLYLVDANTFLVFESDDTRIVTGAELRQF